MSKSLNINTGEYEYISFYGDKCIDQFFDYLSDIKTKDEIYLYAHNGSKYDIIILNDVLFNRTDYRLAIDNFLELNGGVINE